MQSVEFDGLDRILSRWDELLKTFPAAKAELLGRLGRELLEEIRRRIGGRGTVQGWQEQYQGSKNGYAAVRPRAKTYQATRKKSDAYAVGYVTNAIENGHRVRHPQPSGRDGYHYTRGRNTTAAAAGRHFYSDVRSRLGQFGQAELARFAEEIARRLEGAA